MATRATTKAAKTTPAGDLHQALLTLARIDERTAALDTRYVKRDEFVPVQRVVYGLVGLVLLSVFGAMMALILRVD